MVALHFAHLEPEHFLRVECAAVDNDRPWDEFAVWAHEPRLALEEGHLYIVLNEND